MNIAVLAIACREIFLIVVKKGKKNYLSSTVH